MVSHTIFGVSLLAVICLSKSSADLQPAWHWECQEGKCVKIPLDVKSQTYSVSRDVCKIFCHEQANIFPKPTGDVHLGNKLAHVNVNSIDVRILKRGSSNPYIQGAVARFKKLVTEAVPRGNTPQYGGKSLTVYVSFDDFSIERLHLDTDESYRLEVSLARDGKLNATVEAKNYFGARHALETLTQLFVFDDFRNELQMVADFKVSDKPVYPYRGILLDTSRNFFTVESIKRLIDGMAMTKLNTFHWHIIDSHSFPMESKSRPNMTRLGVYSPRQVYTVKDMVGIVKYGLERGVRVLPEFDAPAHVGEGWQNTDYLVCFKKEPWRTYCAEPPCGQLNPTKDGLYDVLEDIYRDMFDIFKPDIFHMGGDEVNQACWSSVDELVQFIVQNNWGTETEGFLQLWNHFQTKAAERVYKVNGNKKLPLILWTSTLTEYKNVEDYLPVDDYIIQIWTDKGNDQIPTLLSKGYKLIMSNYDALYLDCGFSAWVGSGNNWCSPYKGWQLIYDNSPAAIAGKYKDQILGGEAALWSEQADSATLDSRIWPRAAAFAERLWAEPSTGYAFAESRMFSMRDRLVNNGIQADSIIPQWCYDNENGCT